MQLPHRHAHQIYTHTHTPFGNTTNKPQKNFSFKCSLLLIKMVGFDTPRIGAACVCARVVVCVHVCDYHHSYNQQEGDPSAVSPAVKF